MNQETKDFIIAVFFSLVIISFTLLVVYIFTVEKNKIKEKQEECLKLFNEDNCKYYKCLSEISATIQQSTNNEVRYNNCLLEKQLEGNQK